METILVAGATGYLGSHIVKQLLAQNKKTKILVRNKIKGESLGVSPENIILANVTNPTQLNNCCENISTVISTVGITRQKDGLSYMDVDYQANVNLLQEAKKSGVKKFIYVSVFKGEELRQIQICSAKEKFVDELKKSGLEYCVIRPNGFFSDMGDFFNMAQRGKVYLFGDGQFKLNPIHGEDLSNVCINAIDSDDKEINVGGPEIFTHNQIAETAFNSLNIPVKIVHLPDWIRKIILNTGKFVLPKKMFGPVEFFMTAMASDAVSPQYGKHTLKEHFDLLSKKIKQG